MAGDGLAPTERDAAGLLPAPLDPLQRIDAIDALRGIALFGVMVNYLYRLDDIEKNHEAYANDGEVVASSAVKKLLKGEGRRLLDMRLS